MNSKNNLNTDKDLPDELVNAIKIVYVPANMKVTNLPFCEAESSEYGASRLGLDGRHIVFRLAKITPNKTGQFVTVWKRPASTIVPFDINDGIDFVVVGVVDGKERGQFVFDTKTLAEKSIMSQNGKGGKLAFRVYPPWTKPTANAALKSQKWQLRYFFSFNEKGLFDKSFVRALFK